jgi:hypothetical protein
MSSIAHWITELAPTAGVSAGLVALTATFIAAAARTLRVPDSAAEPDWWPVFEKQLAEYMTSGGAGSRQSPDERSDGRVS